MERNTDIFPPFPLDWFASFSDRMVRVDNFKYATELQ